MSKKIVAFGQSGKPFSSAIQAGGFVFISGQGGLDPETGEIVGPDLRAQTIRTLDNIRLILAEAGLTLDDVVKVNVYLKERDLYASFNEIYGSYFSSPYPARTTVYCDLNFDILVEIDAIAFGAAAENE
ncbi:RidA family protein [Paenibacillus sp. LMG 31458]|uniref:RidA family protein n=1 Tax=Paenibacillus phytorum TaxID=2654977 RepID=A0ABX1XUZ2_9BACL|nr:Rid family detoxifying hydrolase [Paenibacillus phytorum]NOU71599.1 RidA family protein [Paenibacillus phytorum]